MYWRYLKSVSRYYLKKKLYFLFNITGLVLAICSCSFILFWILNELDYDKSFPDYKRLYRITTHIKDEVNGDFDLALTCYPLGDALSSIPGTESVCRLKGPLKNVSFLQDNSVITAKNIFYADSTFFKVFNTCLKSGEPKNVLSEPYSIVISESAASKYFNSGEVVGKSISLNISGKEQVFKISGVFKNIPINSHFHPDYLVSFSSHGATAEYSHWDKTTLYTYVMLNRNTIPSEYLSKLQNLLRQNIGAENADYWSYKIQKVTDIHLGSAALSEIEPGGSLSGIYIVGITGILLLLSTFANYVVISLTSFINRLQESCLRKILGAGKKVLFIGFFLESICILFLAFVLAIPVIEIIFPIFNNYTGLFLKYDLSSIVLIGCLYILLSLILSASLASYYSLDRILSLKSRFLVSHKTKVWFNKVLIIAQFSVASILAVLSVLANNQLQYIMSFNTGINAKNVVIIPLQRPEVANRLSMIKHEFIKDDGIKNISFSSANPVDINMVNTLMHDNTGVLGVKNIAVDTGFVSAMGLKIKTGENFTSQNSVSGIIINECAEKKLNALKVFNDEFELSVNNIKYSNLRVIGVVKDYNFRPLYNPVEPLVIYVNPEMYKYMIVGLSGNKINSTLKSLREKWEKFLPGVKFEFSFLEQEQRKLYSGQEKVSLLLGLFSILTILIAGLGFTGLARFTAEKKAREISIRRILGSSVRSVTVLLSGEFILLIIISVLFAFPVSYLLYSKWINQFSYQIPFSIWPYILILCFSGIIAFTVVFLSIVKIATENPIKVLKFE